MTLLVCIHAIASLTIDWCIYWQHANRVVAKTHSAESSIKLSGCHWTQTQTSEVRWAARFSGHWVVTIMYAEAIPKRPSQRQLKKTSNGRRSQHGKYLSYKPRSNFKPTWNFLKILYVSCKWYFWQKYKKSKLVLGLNSNDRKSTRD